jgi:hypothetical protein
MNNKLFITGTFLFVKSLMTVNYVPKSIHINPINKVRKKNNFLNNIKFPYMYHKSGVESFESFYLTYGPDP